MQGNISQSETKVMNGWDYILLLLKEKTFVVKVTLGGGIVSAFIALFLPQAYLAETKILPPQSGNSSMASLMASQMAGMGFSPSSLGVKTSNDLYISLLKTRGVIDYVIESADLKKTFKSRTKESMRKLLERNLVVRDDKRSGIITLGFKHRDPQVAADIVNLYVEGLQRLNNTLAVTEAGQRRLFFEEQLKNAKENLIKSEEELKYFQQRTGSIKIDDEAKAVIGTVAEMRARISAKEVQLRVMRTYATPENPDLQRLQDEASALKEELRKMESKNISADDSVSTVGKVSSLGTEYVRRMREFRYNEALYEILLKQLEAAKLDESKDAALIQVIEKAEPPESPSPPGRIRFIFNTVFGFFLLAVIYVLWKEYSRSMLSGRGELYKDKIIKELLNFDELRKEFYEGIGRIKAFLKI